MDDLKDLEEFLETFPTPLHYKTPESTDHLWVFWSQDDHEIQQGFQIYNNNNSLSADVDTHGMMISDKIKHAFLSAKYDWYNHPSIIQFWAPVMTSTGRRLLSTSGQPFAVDLLLKSLSKYRQRCMEYQYSINNDPAMIITSDAPTPKCGLIYSYMLPVCFPFQTTSSSCIGVLQISTKYKVEYSKHIIPMIRALKEVGLGEFQMEDLIPYQLIPARDEIEDALRIVCEEIEAAEKFKGIQTLCNYVAPSERTCTTRTVLPKEVTEGLFENTIEEATQKEPGDESDVENSTQNEKILQKNILLLVPEALERGKKTMVENCMAPSQRKYKTAPIHISKEAIAHQYGNTMIKAADNLKVSISTLKRKCKDFGISEWQGPSARKIKVNDSSHQNNKNEEGIGAIEEVNRNNDTLTIKAEYEGNMIKFHLCISEATFITIEEKIGKKFNLTHGTYMLKYLDEDKDWILLSSDEDMSVCIESLRNLGRIVVRMRVLPSTQPICS